MMNRPEHKYWFIPTTTNAIGRLTHNLTTECQRSAPNTKWPLLFIAFFLSITDVLQAIRNDVAPSLYGP